MPYTLVTPVIDRSVRGLCARAYEGHPHGCPNYGCSWRCPPKAPHLEEFYDLTKPTYAIYSAFPLGEHVAAMRARHPDWSLRQLTCVLYWQGAARKRLRGEIAKFRAEHPEVDWLIETTPEAMGCNVTATMKAVGVVLPWPPTEVVYHVALTGHPASKER